MDNGESKPGPPDKDNKKDQAVGKFIQQLVKDACWQHQPTATGQNMPIETDNKTFREVKESKDDKDQENKLSMNIENNRATTELKAFKPGSPDADMGSTRGKKGHTYGNLRQGFNPLKGTGSGPERAAERNEDIAKLPATEKPEVDYHYDRGVNPNQKAALSAVKQQKWAQQKRIADAKFGKSIPGGSSMESLHEHLMGLVIKAVDISPAKGEDSKAGLIGLAMKNDPPVRVPHPNFNASKELMKSLGVGIEKGKIGKFLRDLVNVTSSGEGKPKEYSMGGKFHSPLSSKTGEKYRHAKGAHKGKFRKRNLGDRLLFRSDNPTGAYILALVKGRINPPNPEDNENYEYGHGGEIQLKPENAGNASPTVGSKDSKFPNKSKG
jgi:hypothetical protein